MPDLPKQRSPLFDFSTSRRARIRAKYMAGDRFLEAAALEGLTDRLSTVTRKFENGLWIGESVPPQIAPFPRPGTARISMPRKPWLPRPTGCSIWR